jgi:hypothetical protein
VARERRSPTADQISRRAIAAGIGPSPATRAGALAAREQAGVGEDQVDRDRDRNLGGPPGHPLDQGVGHHLAAAPTITTGVSGFA